MHPTLAVLILYTGPLWEEILIISGPALIMLGALSLRVFSERRWIRPVFWTMTAIGLVYYGLAVLACEWREFMPIVTLYDDRWREILGATIFTDLVLLLSVSEPFWIGFVKRALSRRRLARSQKPDPGPS